MKKLLITGFDPFGGESVNPSWEAVRQLPDRIGQYELTKMQIPTVFGKAFEDVLAAAEELKPDAVISVGQAGGRDSVTPEVVAINLREAGIPDNEGNQPVNVPVIPGGPAAYFATIPVRDMVRAVKDAGIPCKLSYTAGAFVCNDVLYSMLHHCRETTTQVGFIHVPYLPRQAKENVPSMEEETIIKALTIAIEAMK